MRLLIVIRIVHTPFDMGSARDGLVSGAIEKMGQESWEENQRMIERFWRELECEIDQLELDCSRVRVYQDGLPCGGEVGEKIVRKTAEMGSSNYRIVQKLIERGCVLEATESPELLMTEYDHIKATIDAKTEDERADAHRRYDSIKDDLLKRRDAFIAQRIDSSLQEGETGVLFIGALHDVVSALPDDVELKMLD